MAAAKSELDPSKVVIADLGRMSRKRIDRLKKGKGEGWDELERAVAAARKDGHVDKDVLVVLVREREKLFGFPPL